MGNNRRRGRGGGRGGYESSEYSPQDQAIAGAGKYTDSTGMHDIRQGELKQGLTNISNTTEGLGGALGKTLGAGLNLGGSIIGKAARGIGGFFKKLFTGKNPFK